MTEATTESASRPGIVILAAILNFITAGFWLLMSFLFTLLVLLGTSAGFPQAVTQQARQWMPQGDGGSLAINVFFAALICLSVAFGLLFLLLGMGLMKRKKTAWYLQIAMSVLGLVAVPVGTVINAIIILFFFQPQVRGYFKA